ncbi:MAG: hypothetical protein V3S03_08515 [Vicinamibacteria bacterium]
MSFRLEPDPPPPAPLPPTIHYGAQTIGPACSRAAAPLRTTPYVDLVSCGNCRRTGRYLDARAAGHVSQLGREAGLLVREIAP